MLQLVNYLIGSWGLIASSSLCSVSAVGSMDCCLAGGGPVVRTPEHPRLAGSNSSCGGSGGM